MQFDWSLLGAKAPTALVRARNLAHHAVQWATRAARANLEPLPDDSHASLEWDAAHAMLFSQPLPAPGGDIRVGLRIGGLALIIRCGSVILDTYELAGRRESVIGVWLDSALRALNLKPAGGVRLPYALPAHSVARGGAYNFSGEAEALHELACWFGAAADVLTEVRAKFSGGAVLCWPHHFDMATLVSSGQAEIARPVSIGVSPGDEHYGQPYVYVTVSRYLESMGLPPLPAPGHWHTQGFVAAVATGDEILTLAERRPELLAFINAAFEIVRARQVS